MPGSFIQQFDTVSDLTINSFESAFAFEADGDITRIGKGIFDATFNLEADGVNTSVGIGSFDALLEFEAHGFLADEPNILGEASFDALFELLGTPYSNGEALSIFESAFEFYADGLQIIPEVFFWNVLVNTLPASGSGVYRRFDTRLTVDGNILLVENWSYEETEGDAMQKLNISLAKISDRNLIGLYSSIKFEIGEYIGGVWQWDTLIDTGETNSDSYSITRDRDSSSFTCEAGSNAKLRSTPSSDLVLYDSALITLSASDFQPIPDTNGTLYHTELKPFYQMTLYDVLQGLFVTRSGFSGFETNIANFRLSRVDVQAGQTFIDAIGGAIGMFEPTFREVDGKLIISDTSIEIDSGDPAAMQITIADDSPVTIGLSRNYNRIDAIRMTYSANKREYDYTATRQTTQTTPYGSFGDDNYQEVTVTKNFIDYFRASDPFNAIDTDLVSVSTSTVKNAQTIFESNETFTYDLFGNPSARTKEYSKRLPDIENSGAPALLTIKTESENWQYKPHPFINRAKYLAKHELYERGKQVTDSTNQQLGEDWKRDYENAYRGGNLTEDLTVTLAPLRTLVEQYRPLKGGKAEVSIYEVDEAGNEPVVIQDQTQTVAGEIATSGLTKTQLTMYVLESDGSILNGSRIIDLSVGELPLTQAKALARRKLRKSKRSPRSVTFDIAGYRRDLKKGVPVNPLGRNNEDLGDYAIRGFRIRGDRNRIMTTISGEEL